MEPLEMESYFGVFDMEWPAEMIFVVTAAGAVILLAYFGPRVGFAFVKRLLKRLSRSV